MKAEKLLKTNTSTEVRANEFAKSIKRNIKRDMLDVLTTKMEKIDDEIFNLKDFSLETNLNSGMSAISRDEAEKRFSRLIVLEYEKELLRREIKIKFKAFKDYFGKEEVVADSSDNRE